MIIVCLKLYRLLCLIRGGGPNISNIGLSLGNPGATVVMASGIEPHMEGSGLARQLFLQDNNPGAMLLT